MNWQGIKEFIAVIELGSFTTAAKQLGISTAQVSRQINALESRLACKLLYRTTRKVTASEAGQFYYQQCRELVDSLEAAELALADMQSSPVGKLRITCPVTYGELFIAPLINDFCSLYPRLKIQLDLNNRLVDLVEENCDLAIRLGRLNDSSLHAKQLAQRRFYTCAAPSYLAQYGTPTTPSDLEQHNCLAGINAFWRFRDGAQDTKQKISGSLHCNSGRALLDAAIKGLGLIQLPDYYLRSHLRDGSLVTVLEQYQMPTEGIWALYPNNKHPTQKLRLLLDFLSEGLIESEDLG